MKKYLIDTNILRILLEYKSKKLNDNSFKKFFSNKQLYILDYTLFELISYITTNNDSSSSNEYKNLLSLLKKYNIDIVCHHKSNELLNKWNQILKNKLSIIKVKKICFESFINPLINFIFDISKFLSLSILQILASNNYNYNWYIEGSEYINSDEYRKIFIKNYKNIFYRSYFENENKARDITNQIFKESIIWSLSFYSLYNSELKVSKGNFKTCFRYYMKEYKDNDYFNLLDKVCKNDNYAKILNNNIYDLDYLYIYNICKYLINHKKKYHYNDLVDFLNFRTAYKNNFSYLTLDLDSLKIYKRIFLLNVKVIEYIKECKNESNYLKSLINTIQV